MFFIIILVFQLLYDQRTSRWPLTSQIIDATLKAALIRPSVLLQEHKQSSIMHAASQEEEEVRSLSCKWFKTWCHPNNLSTCERRDQHPECGHLHQLLPALQRGEAMKARNKHQSSFKRAVLLRFRALSLFYQKFSSNITEQTDKKLFCSFSAFLRRRFDCHSRKKNTKKASQAFRVHGKVPPCKHWPRTVWISLADR